MPQHPAFWVLYIPGIKLSCQVCTLSDYALACLPGLRGIFLHLSLLTKLLEKSCVFSGPLPPWSSPTSSSEEASSKTSLRLSQSGGEEGAIKCPRSHSASKWVPVPLHMDNVLGHCQNLPTKTSCGHRTAWPDGCSTSPPHQILWPEPQAVSSSNVSGDDDTQRHRLGHFIYSF